MTKLIVHSGETAPWHALVVDAQAYRRIELGESLEHYLVYLLHGFCTKPDIVSSILGIEFLESLQSRDKERSQALRAVGDKCLFLSGLFPSRAKRFALNLSYFVDIGQSAYFSAAQSTSQGDILSLLSAEFIKVMDVMHGIREVAKNEPLIKQLEAIQLWHDTGDDHALVIAKRFGNDNLILDEAKDKPN